MWYSILQFNEFVVKILEKTIKNFIEEPKQDIGDLIMSLEKPLKELQCNLIAETLEIIDEIYREDSVRKKKINTIAIIHKYCYNMQKGVLYNKGDKNYITIHYKGLNKTR